MSASTQFLVAAAALLAAGASGYLSVRAPVATAPTVVLGPLAPAPGEERSLAEPEPAVAPNLAARPARRVSPEMKLSDQELEYLRHDPEKWATEQIAASRDLRAQLCKARLRDPSEAYCERIFQAFTRVTPQYLAVQQKFLGGELDQDQYQAAFHRIMLEQTVDIESAMSPHDYFDYLGIPQGEDVFIDLNGGLARMESVEFKLGNEIFDREVTQ